jgi:basic membrane protein A
VKKRWLTLAVIALGVAAMAAGCGGSKSSSSSGNTTTTGSSATSSGGSKFTACLVSDVAKFNDKGFNENQLNGAQKAAKDMGINVITAESNSAADYIPNLASCGRKGANIVLAAGFLLAKAENTVAKQYPKVDFTITDDSIHDPAFTASTNIAGLTYATQENSYLVGCLAGLMVKKQGGKQVIGVVGGIKIPPVDTFLAGYKAGAEKCDPGITVLIGYSQDFNDKAKCKTVAQNQIDQGSQVEFNVAGPCGIATLDAANQAGIWGVGVDVDQAYLYPKTVLTSAVKRVDVGVYDAIKAAKDGTFKGGQDLVFNLKNNGVALGKVNSKVPKEFLTKVNQLKQQIIAGKIVPPTALPKSG